MGSTLNVNILLMPQVKELLVQLTALYSVFMSS